jgi:hypothetical protein
MERTRASAIGVALLVVSLGTACSGGWCGSARSVATSDVPAALSGQSASASDPPSGLPRDGGPGLRGSSTDSPPLPVPRRIDLSHVEPAHFAAALGQDPSRIFEYVRDRIAYEPYVGCLRGPRGTLLAMAGNSVDRAALLGALLKDSGLRVRFARGTLPDALAQQLVASIWHPRALPIDSSSSGEFDPVATKLVADIKRDAALVISTLRSANLPTSAESFVTLDSLHKQAREHYWVEWWKDGAWTALDPSFASAIPGQVYGKPDAVLEQLPDGVFHRVDIRVRVEEHADGKATTRQVLSYSARAADLSGVDLILAHQPTAAGNQGPSQVKPFLVVGQKQVAGSPFSLKPPQVGAAAASLDAFGGGAEETPLVAAESVEMEFVAPDGRREVIVREIFDRIGKARRAKGEAADAESLASASTEDLTAGIYDFFFTTGAIDAGHLRNLAAELPDKHDSMDVGAGLRRINTIFCTMSDLLTSRVAGADGPILRSYLDTPRLQVSEWVPRNGALRISLDLRRDAARVVTSEYTPDLSFRAQVLRGVISGCLERLVIEHFTRARDERDLAVQAVVNTSALFERARAANMPFTLLIHGSPELGSDVPPDARARIAEAIAAKLWVVTPKGPVQMDGASRLAWWQIDPSSGATVGVTDEGLHQANVEAVIVRMDGRGYSVAFRVNGRFISTRGQLFRFGSRAEAENFVVQLGNRLTAMGMDYGWFAI